MINILVHKSQMPPLTALRVHFQWWESSDNSHPPCMSGPRGFSPSRGETGSHGRDTADCTVLSLTPLSTCFLLYSLFTCLACWVVMLI